MDHSQITMTSLKTFNLNKGGCIWNFYYELNFLFIAYLWVSIFHQRILWSTIDTKRFHYLNDRLLVNVVFFFCRRSTFHKHNSFNRDMKMKHSWNQQQSFIFVYLILLIRFHNFIKFSLFSFVIKYLQNTQKYWLLV